MDKTEVSVHNGFMFGFLPASQGRWTGDPLGGPYGDFIFIGWFVLTGICAVAIGAILSWAYHRKNKWLLLLAVPPAAEVVFAVGFILRRLWASLWAELKPIWHANNWFPFVLCSLALYLWIRGNKYREQAERYKTQLEIAWEALNKQPSRCPHCGAPL
jgi:uncharacterized membrane protein YfcA